MVGKVYITSNSSAEKVQASLDLVAEAIYGKIATDTASKNALNKLHLALTKVLGEGHTVRPSIEEDQPADPTLADNETKAEEESDRSETKMAVDEDQAVTGAEDTVLEELLDDEDDDGD